MTSIQLNATSLKHEHQDPKALSGLHVLLDLNYTLVGNSHSKASPFIRQIDQEEYRRYLVNLVKPHYVHLVTARPAKYSRPTLARIVRLTGWLPCMAFFNGDYGLSGPPPVFKRKAIEHLLANSRAFRHAKIGGRVVAVESNPRTRKVYDDLGIPSMRIAEDKEGNTV